MRGRQKIFRPLLYPTLGGVCKILRGGGGELMHQVAPTSFAKKGGGWRSKVRVAKRICPAIHLYF